MKKILLVDGNLLLFRSFYAAQVIVKDQPINMGIHLFFNTFLEIFKKENTVHIIEEKHNNDNMYFLLLMLSGLHEDTMNILNINLEEKKHPKIFIN